MHLLHFPASRLDLSDQKYSSQMDAGTIARVDIWIVIAGIRPGCYGRWCVSILRTLSDFNPSRSDARHSIWLEGDGEWNGGPIPGADIYTMEGDGHGELVYQMRMWEARQIFEHFRLKGEVLWIDHPDRLYLHYAVVKGRNVGVFKGW
jgi:hypothetical protein